MADQRHSSSMCNSELIDKVTSSGNLGSNPAPILSAPLSPKYPKGRVNTGYYEPGRNRSPNRAPHDFRDSVDREEYLKTYDVIIPLLKPEWEGCFSPSTLAFLDDCEDIDKDIDTDVEAEEEPLYCTCRGPDEGTEMVQCANAENGCLMEWFHIACLSGEARKRGFRSEDVWFCDRCIENKIGVFEPSKQQVLAIKAKKRKDSEDRLGIKESKKRKPNGRFMKIRTMAPVNSQRKTSEDIGKGKTASLSLSSATKGQTSGRSPNAILATFTHPALAIRTKKSSPSSSGLDKIPRSTSLPIRSPIDIFHPQRTTISPETLHPTNSPKRPPIGTFYPPPTTKLSKTPCPTDLPKRPPIGTLFPQSTTKPFKTTPDKPAQTLPAASKTIPPSPQNRSWASHEEIILIEVMRDLSTQQEEFGESLWIRVSEALRTYGVFRSPAAAKAIWSRELRERSGIDERRTSGGAMRTSLQKKKGGTGC